ncbi:MAG: IPT/TIG domain-containing protein [Acidobacteriia bacterium]|nr:IPT/TIG domain-containing protein [Terriglobia bacterium]
MQTGFDSSDGRGERRGFQVLAGGAHSHATPLVRWFWWLLCAGLLAFLVLVVLPQLLHAGGPRYIAGSTYFDPGTKGVPLTWAQGAVNYYTDQGDLSPLLPQAGANDFVADAFSRWTSISTAAVSSTLAGQLSEDVSGANVIANPDGTITMPSDILPDALTKPLAIVYDADGQVTDALLGLGAGGADYCFTNAVFGGPDNLSTDAHIVHALIIMNGNCAQTPAQLPDVKYRLVRVLGRVLGLDWSQANLNVITRKPVPTADDYNGFTIMHALDPDTCVPISVCYPNADLPKMDDRAALSRLYPVTTENQDRFPGKQLFFENTIRIHGAAHFVDDSGSPAQGMQGVNVVARWIDPGTGKASRSSVATSVSGFLFRGNAGNPVNGFTDSTGQNYDRFGSDDASLEGWFDLAGLEIPNGAGSAQYQLSIEVLDPLWSQAVGPYGPWQVQPSGAAQAITVTVSKGGDVQQDILMQGSAIQTQDTYGSEDYSNPAPLPASGDWMGSLSGYGNTDYFSFSGQNNRTLSVEVTAMDETSAASQSKSLPVIGIWALPDPPGTLPPAATPMAFNTLNFGMTRLDAVLFGAGDFRIGVADYRGDGRPDYSYHMRLFYGDTVTPARANVGGGTPLTVNGFGFRPGNTAAVGTTSAAMLSVSPNQVMMTAPAMADGLQAITLSDPDTGSASTMTDVLTYGAGPNDTISLIAGSNPATPVGAVAANPIRVAAYAADGVTPVAGASIFFSVTPHAAFSACGNAASCTLLTDESGQVSTRVTVLSAGTMTITAALAPASYNPPKTVQTGLQGTSSALDIALTSPYVWIAQGASLDVPLTARLLSFGSPVAGRTVNYQVVKGSGTLTFTTTTTNASGDSNNAVHLSNMSADVWVSACVEPGDNPCQTFYLTSVLTSALQLQPVDGSVQVISADQNFHLVTVRVTDSSTPSNPVRGAGVVFEQMVYRLEGGCPVVQGPGDTIIIRHPTPVIVSSSQTTVQSDTDGLASVTPSTGGVQGTAEIAGTATAGASALTFALESLSPMGDPGDGSGPPTGGNPGKGHAPKPWRGTQ